MCVHTVHTYQIEDVLSMGVVVYVGWPSYYISTIVCSILFVHTTSMGIWLNRKREREKIRKHV